MSTTVFRGFGLIAVALTVPQASFAWTFNATTSVSSLISNNTSASSSWTGNYNNSGQGFWDQGATNISKVPVGSLLPGYNVKILAETQDWWCNANSNTKYCPNSHIKNGEDSTSMAQAVAQVNDMLSRGITGQVLDWYTPSQVGDIAARNVMAAAEGTGGKYQFAIMIDKGSLGSCNSGSSCTSAAQTAINYVMSTFGGSSAYMRDSGGHPLIYWFLNQYYSQYGLINWSGLNTQGARFIMYEPNGFGGAKANVIGEYGWPNPADGSYVNGMDSKMGFSSLLSYYNAAMGYQGSYIVPELYKGFDDNLASWTMHRVIDQQCGQTWLQTFNHTGSFAGSSSYLGALNYLKLGKKINALMIDTWDDYEEGTETETGIDNCMGSVSISLSGSTLSWAPHFYADKLNSAVVGQENTVHHYGVYVAQQGSTSLMHLADLACSNGVCPHSVNVANYGITGGPYVFYVQAVGQPMIKNMLSGASSAYNPGGGSGGTNKVTISAPASGASVSSPVLIQASCTATSAIDHMEVWVDGVKLGDVFASSINQSYSVGAGSHTLGINCNGGSGGVTVLASASENFSVAAASGVSISSPASGATVSSPVLVKATCTTSQHVDHMEVWVNGIKLGNILGAVVNQSYSMSSGSKAMTINCNGGTNGATVLYKASRSFSVP